jgi:hypothetical protein
MGARLQGGSIRTPRRPPLKTNILIADDHPIALTREYLEYLEYLERVELTR